MVDNEFFQEFYFWFVYTFDFSLWTHTIFRYVNDITGTQMMIEVCEIFQNSVFLFADVVHASLKLVALKSAK